MKYFLIPIILLTFFSCGSVTVTQNFDKTADFKSYKTFCFYPWDTHNDKAVNDYDKQIILMAVKSEMQKKGYIFVKDEGDLIISTFVILQGKTETQAYTNHYGGYAGYGGGWNYYGSPWAYGYGMGTYSTTTVTSRDYVEGNLLFDVFDFQQKKLIWQGIGSGEVNPDFSNRDRNIEKAVSHIFRRYPMAKK